MLKLLAIALACGLLSFPSTARSQGVVPYTNNTRLVQSCSDTSGSGTAQTCTTSPTFVPVANQTCVIYTTTTSNSSSSLTLNVNSTGAKSVAKGLGNTTLAVGDIPANQAQLACYNGTVWNVAAVAKLPVQITSTFIGTPANSQLIFYAPVTVPITIPSSCSGSKMTATAASTASAAFTVTDLTSSTVLCTATFSASGTTATFSGAGGVISAGDVVEVTGPSTADATLANLGMSIYGLR